MWFLKRHPPPFSLLFQVCPRRQGDPQSLCRQRPLLIMSLSRVGSLAQFYSDCLWQKNLGIELLVGEVIINLISRMASVVLIGCFQGILGPPCQAPKTWLCPCFSVAPITGSQARLKALDGRCVSTKSPLMVSERSRQWSNWKEQENGIIIDC